MVGVSDEEPKSISDKTEVLVWPLSLKSSPSSSSSSSSSSASSPSSSSGVLLGWTFPKIASNDAATAAADADAAAFTVTIVAGLLPFTLLQHDDNIIHNINKNNNNNNNNMMQHEAFLQNVRDKLDSFRNKHAELQEQLGVQQQQQNKYHSHPLHEHCELVRTLSILSWWDQDNIYNNNNNNNKTNHNNHKDNSSTGPFHIDSFYFYNRTVPWLDCWETTRRCQIVYYQDGDPAPCYIKQQSNYDNNNTCSYNDNNGNINITFDASSSVFDTILRVISRAPSIVQAFRDMDYSKNKVSNNIIISNKNNKSKRQQSTDRNESKATKQNESPITLHGYRSSGLVSSLESLRRLFSSFSSSLLIVRVYSCSQYNPLTILLQPFLGYPCTDDDNDHHPSQCHVCGTHSSNNINHHNDSFTIQKRVAYWNETGRTMLNFGVGIMLVVLLWEPTHIFVMIRQYIQLQANLLQQGTIWLERFPIGFKLNEPLTQSMGDKIQRLVASHAHLVLQILPAWEENDDIATTISGAWWVQQAWRVVLSVTLLTRGGMGVLALGSDILVWLLHAHVYLLSRCFRNLFQLELYMLAALWRVFRGKKRNILRNRTDSMQYDSIQLLLGTILFAVALFLFTTVLVYHAFFAVCHLMVLMTMQLFPYLAILILREWPAGVLWTRYAGYAWYAKAIHLLEEEEKEGTMTMTTVTTLHPVRDSILVSIAKDCQRPCDKLIRWLTHQVQTILIGTTPEPNGDEF